MPFLADSGIKSGRCGQIRGCTSYQHSGTEDVQGLSATFEKICRLSTPCYACADGHDGPNLRPSLEHSDIGVS